MNRSLVYHLWGLEDGRGGGIRVAVRPVAERAVRVVEVRRVSRGPNHPAGRQQNSTTVYKYQLEVA